MALLAMVNKLLSAIVTTDPKFSPSSPQGPRVLSEMRHMLWNEILSPPGKYMRPAVMLIMKILVNVIVLRFKTEMLKASIEFADALMVESRMQTSACPVTVSASPKLNAASDVDKRDEFEMRSVAKSDTCTCSWNRKGFVEPDTKLQFTKRKLA